MATLFQLMPFGAFAQVAGIKALPSVPVPMPASAPAPADHPAVPQPTPSSGGSAAQPTPLPTAGSGGAGTPIDNGGLWAGSPIGTAPAKPLYTVAAVVPKVALDAIATRSTIGAVRFKDILSIQGTSIAQVVAMRDGAVVKFTFTPAGGSKIVNANFQRSGFSGFFSSQSPCSILGDSAVCATTGPGNVHFDVMPTNSFGDVAYNIAKIDPRDLGDLTTPTRAFYDELLNEIHGAGSGAEQFAKLPDGTVVNMIDVILGENLKAPNTVLLEAKSEIANILVLALKREREWAKMCLGRDSAAARGSNDSSWLSGDVSSMADGMTETLKQAGKEKLCSDAEKISEQIDGFLSALQSGPLGLFTSCKLDFAQLIAAARAGYAARGGSELDPNIEALLAGMPADDVMMVAQKADADAAQIRKLANLVGAAKSVGSTDDKSEKEKEALINDLRARGSQYTSAKNELNSWYEVGYESPNGAVSSARSR